MNITQTAITRTTVVVLGDLRESPHDVLHDLIDVLGKLGCGSYTLGWTNFRNDTTKAVVVEENSELAWIIDPEAFHDDLVTFLRGQRGMLHDEIDLKHGNGEAGHDSCLDGHDWRLEFTVEEY